MTDAQKDALRSFLETLPQQITFRHGDCVGADAEAHDIVREVRPEAKVIKYPSNLPDKTAGKEADEVREPNEPLQRNKDIVRDSDLVIGAPRQQKEIPRSGTWMTLRETRRKNKAVVTFGPNGEGVTWKR